MFVSKLLNKLFFNTNNDCCFTTLLNLNQFMLTKDNYKKILDVEPIKPDGLINSTESSEGFEEFPVASFACRGKPRSVPRISEADSETDTPDENSSPLYGVEKSDDDELLKRKNEFHSRKIAQYGLSTENLCFAPPQAALQNIQHEQRCITPIPFPLPDQTHPVTKSPSELVVGIQRIPDQITPENLFRPIDAVPTPANIMEIIETPFSGEYSPKQSDTLFWCIFIIANGYGEYINIDRNYGVKELEIKKQIGEFTANKGYQKSTPNYKITNGLRGEIHSELLTSQKDTSFPCLLILCCYYKINVVLLHPNGKLMLEFISNTDAETSYYILKKSIHGKYSVNTDKKTWKDVQEMKTKYVCIGNYMKPIKAAGNYKIEDLEVFAEKLGVLDATKKYKKVELYQLVQEHMNWFVSREPTVPLRPLPLLFFNLIR